MIRLSGFQAIATRLRGAVSAVSSRFAMAAEGWSFGGTFANLTRHNASTLGRMAFRAFGGSGLHWGSGGGSGGGGRNAYDAAKTSRADAEYRPPLIDINEENQRDLPMVWAKVWHLVINDPHVKNARDMTCRNTIGSGIRPSMKSGNVQVDRTINEVLLYASEAVDKDRKQTLGQSQLSFLSTLWAAGEAGVFLGVNSAHRGWDSGPVIQIVDTSSRMPLHFNREARGGSNRVRQGIEIDDEGRMVAVWISNVASNAAAGYGGMGALGGGVYSSLLSERELTRYSIERFNFARLTVKEHQLRGTPWPLAVVEPLRTSLLFTDTALTLEQIRCCLGIFMTNTGTDLLGPGADAKKTSDNVPITTLKPGMVGQLPRGADVKTISPTMNGQQLESVLRVLERQFSVAMGLGRGEVTRDRSQSTYSSDRADRLESEALFEEFGRLVWTEHTRPWAAEVIRWAVLKGQINDPQTLLYLRRNPNWWAMLQPMFPSRRGIDPLKEANASKTALQNGFETYERLASQNGWYWKDLITQRISEVSYAIAEAKRLGVPESVAIALFGVTVNGGQPVAMDAHAESSADGASGGGSGGSLDETSDGSSDGPGADPLNARRGLALGTGLGTDVELV